MTTPKLPSPQALSTRDRGMLLATTDEIPGHEVLRVLGLVRDLDTLRHRAAVVRHDHDHVHLARDQCLDVGDLTVVVAVRGQHGDDGTEFVCARDEGIAVPEGTRVQMIQVGGAPPPNVAVGEVEHLVENRPRCVVAAGWD